MQAPAVTLQPTTQVRPPALLSVRKLSINMSCSERLALRLSEREVLSAGGEGWGRAQMGPAGQQSMLGNGPLQEQRRHELGRTGMLGIDPGGHPHYHQREGTPPAGPHYQVMKRLPVCRVAV